MKTAILQISVLIHSLFHIWLSSLLPRTSATGLHECRQNQQQGWDHHLFNLTYLHMPLPDWRIFQHNERDECPSFYNIFQQNRASAQDLSLCPWTYVKSYDSDRFPMEMFYARCSCKRCASWDISGYRYECRAHYHAFNVIRRVCENGQYRYYQSHQYLPIACVCSHENFRFVGSNG